MEVLRDAESLAPYHGGSFVPTMGALHRGHLALIERARSLGRPVIVSIFVNPTQFGPGEDYERYPRTFDADCNAAGDAGADAVFAPDIATVYPDAAATGSPLPEPLTLPPVATEPQLEDAYRPTHFAGVCGVVTRLFDLVRPRWAIFGEKDYQQLLVIRQMVQRAASRWPDLEIISHPTVRESDGLAMSSRNAYLSTAQRSRAQGLFRALQAAQCATTPDATEAVMHDLLNEHGLSVDYAVVRDAHSLAPIAAFDRPARALIAARVDTIRLIDNAPIDAQTSDAESP